MKIIHSLPVWLPQTQTWMYSQVVELQRLGLDVHVVCERTENLDQFSVDHIHRFTDEPKWRQIFDRVLRRLHWRRHLDFLVRVGKSTGSFIIHSHFGNYGWADLGAVRQLGAKHVVTFYGFDVNNLPIQFPIWRKRYHQLFNEVNLILCEGSHMARCIAELGCPQDKIKVQHLGVDTERIEFKPRQWKPDEPLRVLIAASFREKKGIPYAIDALGQLRREVSIELTIIGDSGSDPESQIEKSAILDALQKNGLIENTRLMGYQAHDVIFREAYQHHIFLHPSVTASNGDTEGGAPVVIIEMLATGMPVISTQHCDIPEVMGPSLKHLLAPERDVKALASIIKRLIEESSCWSGMAELGYQHVLTNYKSSKQQKVMLENYQQIVN